MNEAVEGIKFNNVSSCRSTVNEFLNVALPRELPVRELRQPLLRCCLVADPRIHSIWDCCFASNKTASNSPIGSTYGSQSSIETLLPLS